MAKDLSVSTAKCKAYIAPLTSSNGAHEELELSSLTTTLSLDIHDLNRFEQQPQQQKQKQQLKPTNSKILSTFEKLKNF